MKPKPIILISSHHAEEVVADTKNRRGPHTVAFDCEINAFYEAGAIPVIVPAVNLTQEEADHLVSNKDMLVLTGGFDLDPVLWGEEIKYKNVKRYQFRDGIEYKLLKAAITNKKPVMGICRGMQLINVYFGGTLYQNINQEKVSKLDHSHGEVTKMSHKIDIKTQSFLFQVYKENSIWINSSHQMAVKKLGRGLKIAAISSDDIVEAIEHTKYPIYGVEWHPEFAYWTDNNSKLVLDWTIKELV